MRISRALLSVYDKTGIVDFARNLAENDVELISTGGTARALRDAGIPVTEVSDVTGFPEIMDGRVKTLHPLIHGGLLGRLDNQSDLDAMHEHGIQSIDLVVINLYPFEQTTATPGATHDDIIEQIDIGGPAMLRASAKNYRFTAVVTDPNSYSEIIEELRSNDMQLGDVTRLRLASQAFNHTTHYDSLIGKYLSEQLSGTPTPEPAAEVSAHVANEEPQAIEFRPMINVNYILAQTLRYGENPHQQGALYGSFNQIFRQLHGKELSYNNIIDIDAAAAIVAEFEEPTVAIIKHNNPCGVGCGSTLLEAWQKAFATDTTSPFGGIVAVNRPMDEELAQAINEIFTEVIIAPEFSEEVLALLRKKKDRRLILLDNDSRLSRVERQTPVIRSVAGGILIQSPDNALFAEGALRVVSQRQPTKEEMDSMMFAWRVAKHVKSNAIVYAGPDRTLGIGAGQMSRVDSAMIAARKATSAGLDLKGCAVASDAFFPFADGLLEAVQAGATAAIQPGGSVRDQEVIDAADANNIAMMMTGMRHFRH